MFSQPEGSASINKWNQPFSPLHLVQVDENLVLPALNLLGPIFPYTCLLLCCSNQARFLQCLPRRFPVKCNSHFTLVHPFWVAALSNNGNQLSNSTSGFSPVKESIKGAWPICHVGPVTTGSSECSVIESASTGCNICLSWIILVSLTAISLPCLA